MHLSTVCVSTVSSRPRTWSSYSNIRAKNDFDEIITMNSTEEISRYKENPNNICSPTLQRRTLGYSYDFPEKEKKDRKWSIGSLFRRKKKDDSGSSSDEDKKGFLGRRRRKNEPKRKKPVKPLGTFDHVVIQPGLRTSIVFNGNEVNDEQGILSDPTGGFANYIGRALPKIPKENKNNNSMYANNSKESLNDINSRLSAGSGSADSLTRKSRRELTKARAVARRTLKDDSSSEEDSQMSNSSLKIRSEENLRHRDSSLNRRSRAARTERYLKRHSRDGENPNNYLRLSRSDVEHNGYNWKYSDDSNRSPSRSPIAPSAIKSYNSLTSQSTSISGLSTIPPSHFPHGKYRVSNSTSNPSYKPPLSMNEYNNIIKKNPENSSTADSRFNNQRSVSCDANINKKSFVDTGSDILHVQFPIVRPNLRYRNLSLIDASQVNRARHTPPPPPPRDPSRLVTAQYLDNGRPNTYYFENSGQMRSKSFNINSNIKDYNKKYNSFNLHNNVKSSSGDHLSKTIQNLSKRPSSTTSEGKRNFSTKLETAKPENFNYLTDKKPRSRKPIFIQNSEKLAQNTEKHKQNSGTQKALDFWKQRDRENANLMVNTRNLRKSRSNSPQMFTAQTQVQTQIFLPSVLQNESNNNEALPISSSLRVTSPFKPVSPILETNNGKNYNDSKKELISSSLLSDVDKDDIKRKSSNLEEALDELEAIYNSLRLGDEDLLERAEQREREAVAKKLLEANIEPYPNWALGKGHMSDSSFSYEPFDTVDSPKRKRKTRSGDRKTDDMAYRKLNKERSATISDPQSVTSRICYMMTSPVHGCSTDDEYPRDKNEPHVTRDDVVYRNVKHANESLKVLDPQPPFGIPLGPITPSSNSDYLHAVPEPVYKPVLKRNKIPDIVMDDLAFRNLRKDSNKEPALPTLSADDVKNNNSSTASRLDMNYLKKRRAVRSLSANIGSLIDQDVVERARKKEKAKLLVENEYKTLTDIADAMEIARQVLKEKDKKISSTRKAFMSDTDTQYLKQKYKSLHEKTAERRSNFLNGLKHDNPGDNLAERNVSRCTKESTPIPKSPLEEKSSSTNSSLDDLLNALAEEAKETTERITNELKIMSEEREKSMNKEVSRVNTDDDKKLELEKTLSDIDSVSEHAKLCEKLLECAVDSSDVSTPLEEVKQIDDELETKESVANVIVTRENNTKLEAFDKANASESEHDYENLMSDKELNVDEVPFEENKVESETKCTSPFEEHKAELIASFQELKESIKDIETDKSKKREETVPVEALKKEESLNMDSKKPKKDSVYDNLEVDDSTEKNVAVAGEKCVDVSGVVALATSECALDNALNPNFRLTYVSNCDIMINAELNTRGESESSSGFHSNSSCNNDKDNYEIEDSSLDIASCNLDSLESLKSPKLVMASTKLAQSRDLNDSSTSRSGQTVENQSHSSTKKREFQNVNSDDRNLREVGRRFPDDRKSSCVWYKDPAKVAIACSYGIACAHQMAPLDFVAILSILFAVITYIATLFL